MIVKQRATPVFVDCDLVTRNIELGRVAARIGPRTRAIMPTHWPGSLVDMDALYALARHYKLRVIEDAALVHRARAGRDAPSARSAISSRSAFIRTRT